MAGQKYHHLIPRTYNAAWAHGKDSIYIQYKDGEIDERSNGNIGGVNDYHSIIAGMPICTLEDCKKIYSVLIDYIVEYKGKVVTDLLEMNSIYWDFDNWNVKHLDGNLASKKRIKDAIEQVKIKEIEDLWSKKYENGWVKEFEEIQKRVQAVDGVIPEFDKEYLMKFFTMLDWRSGSSNSVFASAFDNLCNGALRLNEVEIPEEERELKFFESASEYMRHCLLLNMYRKYLNDDGVMYDNALKNLQFTNFHFLLAKGKTTFITSDNPVFTYERDDGLKQGLMPISPRILLGQGKNSEKNGMYYVSTITDEAVKRYNRTIRDNAINYIVLDDTTIMHF
ncbi:MAG: DUF4238 domain-containing protein [Clostridiales bacterium]|nr:DUF4238 domain-containing protein [Clostridiales bacterium]